MARPSRWDEVVVSAASVFRKRGFAQATLEEIAENLGMFKGSLYNYIDSKEDLLAAVIQVPADRIVAETAEIAQSDLTSEEKIRALIALHISVIVEVFDFAAVYLHEVARESLDKSWHRKDREYVRLVEEIMAGAVADGTFRKDIHPHIAAMMLIGSINWLTKWWDPEGLVKREATVQEFGDTFLYGLSRAGTRRKSPSRPPRARTSNLP